MEQQDAMLRALQRDPVTRAQRIPTAPLLPAAAVARVASDAPVMGVPSVTPIHRRVARHLWPSAPLPMAEVIATEVAPTVAEVVWPEAPTELPTAPEGYSAQWTEA